MEVENKSTQKRSVGVLDIDTGKVTVYDADNIRVCVPTWKCMQFWATFFACLVAIGIGTFLMCWQGAGNPYFYAGQSLLALGIGVLIPGPKFKDVLPKKVDDESPV